MGKAFLWCVLVPFALLMLLSFCKAVQGAWRATHPKKKAKMPVHW